MTEPITPADLSRELGISQRRIRDVLRKWYGTLRPPETRWRLTESQARAVRDLFRSGT